MGMIYPKHRIPEFLFSDLQTRPIQGHDSTCSYTEIRSHLNEGLVNTQKKRWARVCHTMRPRSRVKKYLVNLFVKQVDKLLILYAWEKS